MFEATNTESLITERAIDLLGLILEEGDGDADRTKAAVVKWYAALLLSQPELARW